MKHQPLKHAYLELNQHWAMPDGNGGIEIYTSSQSVYDEQREIARLLGLEKKSSKGKIAYVGGGFGRKRRYVSTAFMQLFLHMFSKNLSKLL